MEDFFTIIGEVTLGIILVILVSLLWSVVILWAWNAVMPFLFHLHTINIIQAFALSLLGGLVKSTTTTKK